MKKLLAIILVVTIFFSHLGIRAMAVNNCNYETGETRINSRTVEEIMSEYISESAKAKLSYDSRGISAKELNKRKEENLLRRNHALQENGYSFFEVNCENYVIIEDELNTDFRALGLKPECSYFLVLDSGEENRMTRSSVSYFMHTYNGTTYSMRYLYIYSYDNEADPGFVQATYASVLNSASLTIINNCLNTLISAYISSVSSALGIIADICGLSIDLFGTSNSSSSTMVLNGGAAWTRVYTQIYSTYDQLWVNGSSVEYAKITSFMSGLYYAKATNSLQPVPTTPTEETKYSQNYFDHTWRRNTAVQRYLNGLPCLKDIVGSISFYYGNELKFTLFESF